MTTEGIDVRSVGNSITLHETALVEAFNLKAGIEYQLKNCASSMSRLFCMFVSKQRYTPLSHPTYLEFHLTYSILYSF